MTWLLSWHFLAFVLFLTSLVYVKKYMAMPDRVLVMGRDNSFYKGKSCDVGSRCVYYDVAAKAVDVFLARRHEEDVDSRKLAFVYDKKALFAIRARINDDVKMFQERKLSQEPQITAFNYSEGVTGPLVLVEGFLHRNGEYFGYPYYQKLGFALKLRLKRAEEAASLPYMVEKAKYWEWEIKEEAK